MSHRHTPARNVFDRRAVLPLLARADRAATLRLLPPDEKRIVLATMLLFALSRAGIAARGVERWSRTLDELARHLVPGCSSLGDAARTAELARLAAIAASHVQPEPDGLERSLVLCSLLKAQGGAPVLHYGMRRAGDRLETRAWVEHAGLWIDGDEDAGHFVTPHDDSRRQALTA